MGRWEPNASDRLRRAALELYLEQGYERTTVAEIAGRAGLTARTFFRYFADKREVLFTGSASLQEELVKALEAQPPGPAMEAIEAALDAAANMLGGHWELSRRRQAVIAANVELRERELTKLASLAAALAAGLRRRGVAEPEASLAAEAGVAVLRVAFEQWVAGSDERGLAQIMGESIDRLKSLTAH